ncbi:TetR/AcrR family transcriptional regulator [Xanthobacter flavus]|uniref:TetR/AcrR family transcriptional regulator n=1 Tax=Xanthobacter flavus TaxID=281 RepID=UPI00372A948B
MTTTASVPAPGKARAKLTGAKLTRAERNELTKHKLFEAARKVVGRLGYAEASVARITAEAGVAQGTFYNHFTNRQELLDQLLPEIGKDMLRFIRERTRHDAPESAREADRFRAFFDYLKEVPEFLRILNEAELFAPEGYRQHIKTIAGSYARVLRRGRDKGEVQRFTDKEIEVIVHMFMGARGYLSQCYAYADHAVTAVPDYVMSAYGKLLAGGLFTDAPARGEAPAPAAPAGRRG